MFRKHFRQLRIQGYTIVPILTETECDEYIEGIQNDLNEHVKEWNDEETLEKKVKACELLFTKGILKPGSVGQLNTLWKIRQNNKLIAVFHEFYSRYMGKELDKKGLRVSMDSCNITPPWKETVQENGWIHVDQSFRSSKFMCYQGALALSEQTPEDGTTIIVPKSHKAHKKMAKWIAKQKNRKIRELGKKHWYKLSKDELEKLYYFCGEKPVRLYVPKGSIVIWDSRTFHSGSLPLVTRKNKDGWRFATYVSYGHLEIARRYFTERQISQADTKRIKAFDEKRTTSHWTFPVYLNPKKDSNFRRPQYNNLHWYTPPEPTIDLDKLFLIGKT